MMELVAITAGVVCGVLGGTVVSLLLLVLEARFEAAQARHRERQSRILPPVVIVEQRLLEDGRDHDS